MASASGKELRLLQLKPAQIAGDAFVRCPQVRFEMVQVREACIQCPHCAGFSEDNSGKPGAAPLYGSVCAFPIARWHKTIVIHRKETK